MTQKLESTGDVKDNGKELLVERSLSAWKKMPLKFRKCLLIALTNPSASSTC
jgi:hypothetical protein